jgi:hypothetical protein
VTYLQAASYPQVGRGANFLSPFGFGMDTGEGPGVTSDLTLASGACAPCCVSDLPDLRCQSDLTSDFCLLGPIWVWGTRFGFLWLFDTRRALAGLASSHATKPGELASAGSLRRIY